MALKAMILISVMVVMCMTATLNAQDVSCQTVVDSLLPCKTYLEQGGNVPTACCNGVISLNSAANTAADRKIVCQCLKTIAKSYAINPQYASGLPASCKVNIPYPISYDTNCDTVQ
ncbi:non-specific lipid-transfer protein 1-like [Primulina eburnea]|uniref:non-specific lipid-transfer protein 1-like n=1 Tax=Primulina eburnea TaxID=1245227 RepID=UPI003C6BD9F7